MNLDIGVLPNILVWVKWTNISPCWKTDGDDFLLEISPENTIRL